MTDRSNLGPREITCFKAYDVRGELGKNLDADVAYRIGRAFAQVAHGLHRCATDPPARGRRWPAGRRRSCASAR